MKLSEKIQNLLMLIHERRWGGYRGVVITRENNAQEEKELAAIRDEVAALESELAGMELMMQEGEGFYDGLEGKYAALEQRVEGLADLCAEAEGVLDNQAFKVTKETWEGWERWKMGAMHLSEEIKEALAAEDDLSKLTTQQKLTEEDMERN